MDTQSWILILALLAMVIFRQLGEKKFTIKSIVLPIIIVGYFSLKYVKQVPLGGSNTIILVSMIIAGIVLGILMLLSTKAYLKDGVRFVRSGAPYLILWIIGLGSKILVVDYITKWNVSGSVEFIVKHHINPNVISTSFIFFTIAMIAVRIIGVYLKFLYLENKNRPKFVLA